MASVAVEAALKLWASSLQEVKRRIRPLFMQERVAGSAEALAARKAEQAETQRLKRKVRLTLLAGAS